MRSRRQKKVASLIKQAFSEILQKSGSNYYQGAFVTITDIYLTPDLSICRIYLSVYNVKDKQEVISKLNAHMHDLRGQLGAKIRNQVRRIPELEFYLDDTLDRAMRIEELLKKK